jgi:hypothetical protein
MQTVADIRRAIRSTAVGSRLFPNPGAPSITTTPAPPDRMRASRPPSTEAQHPCLEPSDSVPRTFAVDRLTLTDGQKAAFPTGVDPIALGQMQALLVGPRSHP